MAATPYLTKPPNSKYGLRLSDAGKKLVVEMYQRGHSTKNIAIEVGCSSTTCVKILNANGVKLHRPRIFDEATELQIIEAYLASMPAAEIRHRWGCYGLTLTRVLRRRGHEPTRGRQRTPDDLATVICDEYSNGASFRKLRRKHGVSSYCIYACLRRAGIKTRSPSEAQAGRETPRGRHRRHTLNESAFDTLTGPSAYWIGFLMADGAVVDRDSEGQTEVALVISERDEAHLRWFRSFIGSSHAITRIKATVRVSGKYVINSGPMVRLAVGSQRLADALAKYGVVPNKTERTAAPITLRSNRDFWRGVVDGDGYVSLRQREATGRLVGVPAIGLVSSSHALVEQLYQSVHCLIPDCAAKPHRRNGITDYRVTSRFTTPVVKWLYNRAAVSLERKQDIADKIIAAFD